MEVASLGGWIWGVCGDLRLLLADIIANYCEYNRRDAEHAEDERTETTIAQKQCPFF